jgi:hypothetical protein
MVHFALTRKSYDDLVAQLGQAPSPLWVNNGVLSATEIKQLHEAGVDISNFTIGVNPLDPSDVAQAVDTIKEHHPGETVWVEHTDGL